MRSALFCSILLLAGFGFLHGQEKVSPEFLQYTNSRWVDSVFSTLTPDERIAQLIVAAAYSNRGPEHRNEILKLIREQKVGGLIFFQGGPVRETRLLNEYQEASRVPLLVAMDAEWGLGMRLDSTISYPYQMALGAIQNDTLIYRMGAEIARQMKRAGIHVNLAPVADVNNNPENPVINYRSFGEDKINVARKAIAYMKGMQDHGILTTAKHFPGHGDTDTDSHHSLPQINHSRQRLDSVELYPFRRMIDAGVGGVMVAHLNIPALDPSGVPSTLSKPIITDILRNELGFEGLVVTDAMNMRGVTEGNTPGVVDMRAILAGNDMLEFTEDVPRAIAEIRKAIRQGLITQQAIDERCRRMLAVKQWAGLDRYRPVSLANLLNDLNTPEAELLNRNLIESSLTVLNNENALIPVKSLDSVRIASLAVGSARITPFQETLSLYTNVGHFLLPRDARSGYVDTLRQALSRYDMVITAIHDANRRPVNRADLTDDILDLLRELAGRKGSVVAVFKNPYVLDKLSGIENADGLIAGYQDTPAMQELAAQLVFGGIGASGRLPVSIGDKYAAGSGLDVRGGIRFKYTLPEDVGMDSETLSRGIDSLVNQALDIKAIPGCQVLVAKDRKVVFHKAYGLHEYSDTVKVKLTDLYDLASVTKISTSVASLMRLYDEGKFRLDGTLPDYLPKFKGSNKADISMLDILTHQGQLTPWIPFYKNTVKKNGAYKWFTIKGDSSARFPIKLKEGMYLHRNYPDKIVKAIRNAPQLPEKKYVYSDFFFILAPRVIESMIEQDFVTYLRRNFYDPLGATSITYNPSLKYPKNAIVPTEHDYYFRHQPIHGTVHDEGAIMLGGVSGHAGLFGNANDLAKLMQMYLDMGEYGGRRYISEQTLKEWTSVQFPENNNRRGIGFDKPNLRYAGFNNNTARDASAGSFGHTGFTGTMVWMDPQSGLLYIFLSNRVTPTRDNTRLYRLNTRRQVQQIMYDALRDPYIVGRK